MSSQTPSTDYFKVNCQKLDDAIEFFESEWNRTGEAAVDDFLPVAADPEFESFAVELLRVDLERRWKSGSVRSIAEYRDLYPELLERPRVLERLAFEEYRLRKKNGDSVTPADYARRFHIQTDHWPEPSALPETTSTLAREAFSNGIAHEMNRITSNEVEKSSFA